MRSRQFLKIIYEDKDILVIDKPPGVLSEPKADSPHSDLIWQVKGYLKRKYKGSTSSYVKLLHRLDRDTSGIIVAALSKIGENLEDDFREGRIDRQYFAVVDGAVPEERGKIDLPLEKGEFKFGRKVRVAEGGGGGAGKKAVTFFEVLERYSNATVLRIKTGTGRTHQIRVHLAAIGHPLAGDRVYGRQGEGIPFPRQALHAALLVFRHPRTGKKLRLESHLPRDMENLIDQLRESVLK